MANPMRRRATRRGFTLIELAVAIGVIAVLAAALVPDLIEAAKTRMAQKAAEDVSHIHSAAQWYFAESSGVGNPDQARWPGEVTTSGGSADGSHTCFHGASGATAQEQLTAAGYLALGAFTNPWNYQYVVELSSATPGSATAVCGLRVSTTIPYVVSGAFRSFLPNTSCPGTDTSLDCSGNIATGMVCCSSTIPKPGGEAPFKYLTDTWIPQNVYSVSQPPVPTYDCAPNAAYPGVGTCTPNYPVSGKSTMKCEQFQSITITSFAGSASVNHTSNTATGPCDEVHNTTNCTGSFSTTYTTCQG